MAYLKKVWALALILALAWGCSNENLKTIQLQTPTAHLLLLPNSTDTTQILELDSDLWLSVWDSIRQEAGVSQGDIREAIPLQATATLVAPDSTFGNLERFDVYTQSDGGTSTLLASIPEGQTASGQSLSLFANPENHLDNFMQENPTLRLRYQLKEARDTVWVIGLQVTWEMKGSWD